MRFRMTSSNIAVFALALNACTPSNSGGLFDPSPSDSGDAGEAGATNDAGVSSSGGTAGTSGGSAGGASVASAGGGGTTGNSAAGNSTAGSTAVAGSGAAGGGGASAGGGGIAGGGTSGIGGGGTIGLGGAPTKCELMALQAGSLLTIAQTCNAAAAHPYCTGYIKNECGCQVPVDEADSLATGNYVKQRDALLAECKPSCTSPCTEPASQTCKLSGGFVVGMCVATSK